MDYDSAVLLINSKFLMSDHAKQRFIFDNIIRELIHSGDIDTLKSLFLDKYITYHEDIMKYALSHSAFTVVDFLCDSGAEIDRFNVVNLFLYNYVLIKQI